MCVNVGIRNSTRIQLRNLSIAWRRCLSLVYTEETPIKSFACVLTCVFVCVCVCVRQDSLSKQTVYSMHQLQGNKQYGTEKSGYLYKKSDG